MEQFPNEVTRMFLEQMSSRQRKAVSRVNPIFWFLGRTFATNIYTIKTKLDITNPGCMAVDNKHNLIYVYDKLAFLV